MVFKQEKVMDSISLAYMAGIVDGEGCLDILFDNRNNSAIPRLHVEMTHKETIYWLQSIFEGQKIYECKRKNINHSTTYRWVVQGKKCLSLVRELLPYMIGKQEEAKILLSFPEAPKPGKGRRVPKELILQRLELKQQLHNMKLKGKGRLNNGKKIR